MTDQKDNDSDFELEDDDFVEDDWDENHNEMPQQKKKSGGLILALGGILVVGGGIYFAQDILSSNTDPAPAGVETTQMDNPYAVASDENNDLQPMPAPEENVMPGFPEDSESAMTAPGNQEAEGGIPQPAMTDESDFFESNDAGMEMGSETAREDEFGEDQPGEDEDELAEYMPPPPAAEAPASMAAPVEAESVDTTPAQPAQEVDATEVDPEETAPIDTNITEETTADTAESAAAPENEEITALNARISDMEEMLSNIESRLQNQDTTELQDQIDTLSRQISDMQSTADSTPEPAATATAPKPAAPPATRPAEPATEEPDWILRSADSGAAWVSKADSDDMRQITVGDTLSGIGEVRSIEFDRYQGWVVTGSTGSITQ